MVVQQSKAAIELDYQKLQLQLKNSLIHEENTKEMNV